MNFFDSILLALALCVDSLVVSTSCALRNKMKYRRGLLLALVFALFQGGMPLLGALLGSAFHAVIAAVDHWIAFALLSLVGIKMMWDACHDDDEEECQNKMDVSSLWVIMTLGIATSIDAFVVGIGFGLENAFVESAKICLVITIVTFVAALMGVVLGKRNIPISEKWSGILAGVVLIGLGVKTLIEHGAIG